MLIEYGRVIKDGELKMRSHEDSRTAKLRYVFILSRCVIFCKATRVRKILVSHATFQLTYYGV